LIVAAPEGAMGQVCSTPVSLMDIYPTCVDYADLEPAHKLDGFSFRGLVNDPSAGCWDGPSVTVAASASKAEVVTNQPASPNEQHFSIRSERFRYIHCRNGEEELYDHHADPHEWNNLVSNPEYQPALKKMRFEFKSFLERMTGPSTR
jgi:arylsulfatase A-like enzyme